MTDRVRVTEPGPSLKYGALYAADELGYFADEGLQVDTGVEAGPGGAWLVDNLLEGAADIAIGGIWMPLMYRQSGLADLKCIAGLCHANSLLVLARPQTAGRFALGDLVGKRVLVPQGATAQWMFLEGILREQRVDPTRVRFVRDLHHRTTTGLWRRGYGDFYLADSFDAEQLIDEGSVVVGGMADLAGPVPWSVAYATAATCVREDAIVPRFRRALARGHEWLGGVENGDAADLLSRRFPIAERAHIERIIDRFWQSRIWLPDLGISPAAMLRWQEMMIDRGLFDRPARPDEVGIVVPMPGG